MKTLKPILIILLIAGSTNLARSEGNHLFEKFRKRRTEAVSQEDKLIEAVKRCFHPTPHNGETAEPPLAKPLDEMEKTAALEEGAAALQQCLVKALDEATRTKHGQIQCTRVAPQKMPVIPF